MVFNQAGVVQSATKTTTDSFQEPKGKVGDRVLINVGGKRHETYLSTISNFQDTRLYWIAETASKMADFDPESNEFFFDRHPGCFENILNFCRTGKLHCPNDVCGPLFEEELAFWGVDELQMEPCCWGTYTQHRNAHKHLKMFDNAMEDGYASYQETELISGKYNSSGFAKRVGRWRALTWAALEEPYSSRYAQIAALVNLVVIVLSIASFCIETMPIGLSHDLVFRKLEYFYCVFFTIDFFVRMFCCPSYKMFSMSLYNWIDFISILQFYINFGTNSDTFDFMFVLRLIRIFRLFRFFKNLSGMQVIGQTLKASARELFLLILIVLIPMVIFSSLIYYAEKNLKKPTFGSIPEAFWWAIITMTTVGYGDVTPKTVIGRIVNALCACLGVLILALPVSVIGSNFTLYYSYAQARLRLPQRTQPALVLADKALINSNGNKGSKDGPNNSLLASPEDATKETRPHPSEADQGIVGRGLRSLADVVVELTVPMQRRQAISPGMSSPISVAVDNKGNPPNKRRSKDSLTKGRTTSKGSTTSHILPAITMPLPDADPEPKEEDDQYHIEVSSRLLSISSTHLEVPTTGRSSLVAGLSEESLTRLDLHRKTNRRGGTAPASPSTIDIRSDSPPSDSPLHQSDCSMERSDSPVNSDACTYPARIRSSTDASYSPMRFHSLGTNNNNNNLAKNGGQRRRHGTTKLWKIFRRSSKDNEYHLSNYRKSEELVRKHKPSPEVYRRPRNGTSLGLDIQAFNAGRKASSHNRIVHESLVGVTPVRLSVRDEDKPLCSPRDGGPPPSISSREQSRSPTFETENWIHTSNV